MIHEGGPLIRRLAIHFSAPPAPQMRLCCTSGGPIAGQLELYGGAEAHNSRGSCARQLSATARRWKASATRMCPVGSMAGRPKKGVNPSGSARQGPVRSRRHDFLPCAAAGSPFSSRAVNGCLLDHAAVSGVVHQLEPPPVRPRRAPAPGTPRTAGKSGSRGEVAQVTATDHHTRPTA